MKNNFIEIQNLTVIDKVGKIVLDNFNIIINPSDFILILGVSGVGKTTALNIIMGNFVSDFFTIEGVFLVFGKQYNYQQYIKIMSKISIGYLPQNYSFALNQQLSIRSHFNLFSNMGKNNILAILDILQLPETILEKSPRELSGGQQQRLAVAIVLSKRPVLLFADEATSALDIDSEFRVLNALKFLSFFFKTSVVLISHKYHLSSVFANKIDFLD